MGAVRVKICGITRVADALDAAALGVHAVGLNFVADSPRRVTLERAREIARALPSFVLLVGVFRDQPGAEVDRIAAAVGLDRLQLHGDEDAEYCDRRGRPVIKVVRPTEGWRAEHAERWPGRPLLVDAWHARQAGGTGRLADWGAARELVAAGRSVILAGGLSPENLVEAVRFVRPEAVDLNSGVESATGLKDRQRLERALAELAAFDVPVSAEPPHEERP